MQSSTEYFSCLSVKPGQDLKRKFKIGNRKQIKTGWINTCGQLPLNTISVLPTSRRRKDSGHFEIVSLTGTVSVNGSHIPHQHQRQHRWKPLAGHLMDSCKIYTTKEIVGLRR